MCLILVVAGCGSNDPELGVVNGTVKLDGQPRSDLQVTFVPKTGGGIASSGITDANGKYELTYKSGNQGAEIGPHTVQITSAAGGGEAGGETGATPISVPPKYNTESTLTKDVAKGENTFDFEITSK